MFFWGVGGAAALPTFMGGWGLGGGGAPPQNMIGANFHAPNVKTLYYDLCKKHHPDKGGNEEVFARITKAYNVFVSPPVSSFDTDAKPAPPIVCTLHNLLEGHDSRSTLGSSKHAMSKRRGFRTSVKLCWASIVHRTQR